MSSFIKYSVSFLFGVYVGQEFKDLFPNVKDYTIKKYNEIMNSDAVKQIKKDIKK